MGLIGLATSQNATEGNVKAKMEEYDRNLVLKKIVFYSENQFWGQEILVRGIRTSRNQFQEKLFRSMRIT